MDSQRQAEREAAERFKQQWHHRPPELIAVPYSVPLLGEHGALFDAPEIRAAINRHAAVAISPRTDGKIHLLDRHATEPEIFWTTQPKPPAAGGRFSRLRGLLHQLAERGIALRGFNAVIANSEGWYGPLSESSAEAAGLLIAYRRLYPFALGESGLASPPERKPPLNRLPALDGNQFRRFAQRIASSLHPRNGILGELPSGLVPMVNREWCATHVDPFASSFVTHLLPGIAILLVQMDRDSTSTAMKSAQADIFKTARLTARQSRTASFRSVDAQWLGRIANRLPAEEMQLAQYLVNEKYLTAHAEDLLGKGEYGAFGACLNASRKHRLQVSLPKAPKAAQLSLAVETMEGCLGVQMIHGTTLLVLADFHFATQLESALKERLESANMSGSKVEICHPVVGTSG